MKKREDRSKNTYNNVKISNKTPSIKFKRPDISISIGPNGIEIKKRRLVNLNHRRNKELKIEKEIGCGISVCLTNLQRSQNDDGNGFNQLNKHIDFHIDGNVSHIINQNFGLAVVIEKIASLLENYNKSLHFFSIKNLFIDAFPPNISMFMDFLEKESRPSIQIISGSLQYIPYDICNLRSLYCLCINDSNLKFLPLNIGEMTNLEVLCLSGNNITFFPLNIKNLKNLKIFSFSNQKTNLPIKIGESCRSFIKAFENMNFIDVPIESRDYVFVPDDEIEYLESNSLAELDWVYGELCENDNDDLSLGSISDNETEQVFFYNKVDPKFPGLQL